jgi:hypothetical protein
MIKHLCDNCGKEIYYHCEGRFPIRISVEPIYQADRRNICDVYEFCNEKCANKSTKLKDAIKSLGAF